MTQNTINELLTDWDKGEPIWSIEMGGFGPGYEQAIQIAAVEFARACKDMQGMKNNDKSSTEKFRSKCDEILHLKDDDWGGLSGAQYGAATWLAWNWCFNGGPEALLKRCDEKGESNRKILVSKAWPKA